MQVREKVCGQLRLRKPKRFDLDLVEVSDELQKEASLRIRNPDGELSRARVTFLNTTNIWPFSEDCHRVGRSRTDTETFTYHILHEDPRFGQLLASDPDAEHDRILPRIEFALMLSLKMTVDDLAQLGLTSDHLRAKPPLLQIFRINGNGRSFDNSLQANVVITDPGYFPAIQHFLENMYHYGQTAPLAY